MMRSTRGGKSMVREHSGGKHTRTATQHQPDQISITATRRGPTIASATAPPAAGTYSKLITVYIHIPETKLIEYI